MRNIRIKTKPLEVVQQANTCATGIGGEANWPTTNAPAAADLTTAADNLVDAIMQVADLKAQIVAARENRDNILENTRDQIKRVDQVTDGLYGPTSPAKGDYGISPRAAIGSPSGPISIVVVRTVRRGNDPGSIYLNWEALDNAGAYLVEWFADSDYSQPVGHAISTVSQHTISDLTPGNQYWVRVRGGIAGPWSDVSSLIAGN